jgi:hypothetical protein
VSEHSLFGSSTFKNHVDANVAALGDWATAAQDAASPVEMSRENFGNAAKSALQAHQQGLVKQSGDLFSKLSADVGDTQPDTTSVRNAAQSILNDNGTYYANHPELLKGGAGQAWSIVNDLAGADAKPKVAHPRFWIVLGNRFNLQRLQNRLTLGATCKSYAPI